MFQASKCLAAMAIIVLAGQASAQDNPILDKVKASVADASKPFAMGVIIKVKDGEGAAFEKAFVKAIKATRAEKGCLTYDLNRDLEKQNLYIVYERWRDVASLETHIKSAHIATLLMEIGSMVEGPPEVRVFALAGE